MKMKRGNIQVIYHHSMIMLIETGGNHSKRDSLECAFEITNVTNMSSL